MGRSFDFAQDDSEGDLSTAVEITVGDIHHSLSTIHPPFLQLSGIIQIVTLHYYVL